jgi:hypothetical protein
MVVPMVLDGLINGVAFQDYVDPVLRPRIQAKACDFGKRRTMRSVE